MQSPIQALDQELPVAGKDLNDCLGKRLLLRLQTAAGGAFEQQIQLPGQGIPVSFVDGRRLDHPAFPTVR